MLPSDKDAATPAPTGQKPPPCGHYQYERSYKRSARRRTCVRAMDQGAKTPPFGGSESCKVLTSAYWQHFFVLNGVIVAKTS